MNTAATLGLPCDAEQTTSARPDGALQSAAFAGGRNGNPRILLPSGSRQIFVNGTHNNDVVNVTEVDSNTIRIRFIGVDTAEFDISAFDSILFKARKGNDQFNNLTSIPSFAYGDEGEDLLYGGQGVDELDGGAGPDRLYGRQGNDRLIGGHGDDTAFGANGDDFIRGGVGDDRLFGENGNDTLIGDAGNDFLHGSFGSDTLHGWTGDDIMYGGPNDDWLYAYGGNDSVNGDSGNDWLDGGSNDDRITGGNGNDMLLGRSGDDKLFGNAHNDTLWGHDGRDQLIGGNGNDILNGGAGIDVLLGGVSLAETDRIRGDSGADHLLYFASHVLEGAQSGDVRIRFEHGPASWNTTEILVIDEGLMKLHAATNNNALTVDYITGKDLKFVKYASLPGNANAVNYMQVTTTNGNSVYRREIRFADWDESQTTENTRTIIALTHEIAHNFDNGFELTAHPRLKPSDFTAFRSHSDWRTSDPGNPNYSQSGDGQWWYSNNAQFYRSYSTISPYEDWATIWELYFDETVDRPSPGSSLGRKLNTVSNIIDRIGG